MAQRKRTDAADRTALTPRAVAEGALALADSAGLEAVTIRRLAQELGVTPMALYWHFRSKGELLDGMVDRLYEKIDPAVGSSEAWQRQLRTLLEAMVAVLRDHPAAAPLLATRSTASESSLRTTEAMLAVLRRAGFSPAEATQIARHALSTVADLVVRVRAGAAPEAPGDTADERRRARAFLESLPPARYPRLVEAAAPLSACEDPDSYYDFGLDLLMAGVEAMAARPRSYGG